MSIPIEKIRNIAQQLLKRSKLDQVNWQCLAQVGNKNSFCVELTDAKLRIEYQSPQTEPDYVLFTMCNSRGEPVGQIGATEVDEVQEDWMLLNGLWEDARRHVTKWDKTLASVEEALSRDEKIGIEENPF